MAISIDEANDAYKPGANLESSFVKKTGGASKHKIATKPSFAEETEWLIKNEPEWRDTCKVLINNPEHSKYLSETFIEQFKRYCEMTEKPTAIKTDALRRMQKYIFAEVQRSTGKETEYRVAAYHITIPGSISSKMAIRQVGKDYMVKIPA